MIIKSCYSLSRLLSPGVKAGKEEKSIPRTIPVKPPPPKST